ncbi:hypothetical protein ACO1PF_04455 [Alkalibacterium sp. f15]|uniref:hypothetical protein n=1 Tax=unclassified Alkalibacterium TaxID=261054 RepID=UPI000A8EEB84|nr:hypothetical protein [Alkalibacterium sp. 20]
MDIDPKTIVTYPLFTFVIYLLLSLVFDLPLWTVFIALFIVFLYFIVIIIIELYK